MVSDALAETWFRMSESTPDEKLAQIYLKNALRLAPEKVQNILGERVREKLPEQVRDRDYAGAVKSLCSLLEMHGWESTFLLLQDLCSGSDHLRERGGDVLLHLFELEPLMGLDIDPLAEFSGLVGNDLECLRREAQERAFHALKWQVASGNTYYLDVEQLRDLPFLLILPDILNIREQEVLALSDTPSHNEVLGTYYGFTILTSAWSLERGVMAFKEMCATLGKTVELRTRRLNIRASMWKHMSPRMHLLLLHTARLCLVQSSSVHRDAIECLGETGDSRALQVLSEASKHVLDWDARDALKQALGKIGGQKLEEKIGQEAKLHKTPIRREHVRVDDLNIYEKEYDKWEDYGSEEY